MLIDSHAHIIDETYGDGGAKIAADMKSDGLKALVCVGCDGKSSRGAVEAAERFFGVYASVGVHPYYPEEVTDELLAEFKKLAGHEKVVAIGEIGLDYHHDEYDREAQIAALIKQYDLAVDVGLPIIFHSREATGDFTEFLRPREFPKSGVMHCFSGSWETAEICLKKNLYIAFGGKLTYRNARNLVEVASRVPLDRLLIETDAPYLTPAQKLGEVNYPKNVALVRDRLAEIRGLAPDEIERITAENAERLFFKMKCR